MISFASLFGEPPMKFGWRLLDGSLVRCSEYEDFECWFWNGDYAELWTEMEPQMAQLAKDGGINMLDDNWYDYLPWEIDSEDS